jgi:hypothetical protein
MRIMGTVGLWGLNSSVNNMSVIGKAEDRKK